MATRIQRETAERMIAKLQSQLDGLYQKQEGMKAPTNGQEMKNGGRVMKMPLGGFAPLLANIGMLGKNISGQGLSKLTGSVAKGLDMTKLAPMVANKLNPQADLGTKLRMGFSSFMGGLQNGDIANKVGTAAPMLYNFAQGMQKPEQMNAADFHNPMAGQALSSLRNRRFDVDPLLRQNDSAYQTAMQNVQNAAGGSRGAYMSNLGAAMQGSQANAANILSQGQNMNAQFQGDLAGMQAGLGQQAAQTNMQVSDWNAQNRAAQRNFTGQAMSDLSGMTQANRLMDNQMNRDEQLLSLLPDMYGSVYPFMKNLQNIKVQ